MDEMIDDQLQREANDMAEHYDYVDGRVSKVIRGLLDAASAPTARTSTDTEKSVIYAWEMLADDEWNIIGLRTPTGQTLPMVTTSFQLSWDAFDIAQEHASKHGTRCRLASYRFETLMAVVVPDDNDPG